MNNHKLKLTEELLNTMTLVDSYYPIDIGNRLGIRCYSQELDREFNLSEEILNTKAIVDSFYPFDIGNALGIRCYSPELDGEFYLRIFQLEYDETDQDYNIVGELPAIKFKTESELTQFSNNLPHMN